jgi:predicted phage terminase large subunit-like protein
MDNREIISRLWKLDLLDPEVMLNLYSMAVNTEDYKLAVKVWKQCSENIAKLKQTNPQAAMKQFEVLEKAQKYAAIEDFESFLYFNESNRQPEQRFYQPRAKQLRPIVQTLQEAHEGLWDEISISLPARTGKSTLVKLFLIWRSLKFPEKPSLYVTFAQGVCDVFYDGALELLTDTETYRAHEVFPNAPMVYQNKQQGQIDIKRCKQYRSITFRSLYANLNGGADCSNLLICDDLVAGIHEALNPVALDNIYSRYTNNVQSRCKKGVVRINIMTRWSVSDPIGRRADLIASSEKYANYRYKEFSIPALNENDESNFDYDFGVGFTTEMYHQIRSQFEREDDIASWDAQYMNQPYIREGLLFPDSALHRYFELPEREPDAIISVADTKTTGADYAVMPVAYIYGKEVYIEDIVCNNAPPDVVNDLMAQKLIDHKVQSCRFESNSAGERIATEVHDILKKRGANIHITKKHTSANKATKILSCAGAIKDRFYFKDRSCITPGSEYWKAMGMLSRYTIEGKPDHDDVPDALSMLVEYIDSLLGCQIEVVNPFF